jgi:hypothetical protein
MAAFKYNEIIKVGDDESVILEVIHLDKGTVSDHIIDIPPEINKKNEFTEDLGKGKNLKKKSTIIYTKVVNMDIANPKINIQYKINEKVIVDHENLKSKDPSPQLKITLNFV